MKVSRHQTVELARCIHLFVLVCLGKMTAAKTKPAKYEFCSVLRFLMAKHYSAAAVNRETFTDFTFYSYELKSSSKLGLYV